jgi:hypothetical protein
MRDMGGVSGVSGVDNARTLYSAVKSTTRRFPGPLNGERYYEKGGVHKGENGITFITFFKWKKYKT